MLVMELAVAIVYNNCIMHIHVQHMILITGLAFDHNYANRKWPHLMLNNSGLQKYVYTKQLINSKLLYLDSKPMHANILQ